MAIERGLYRARQFNKVWTGKLTQVEQREIAQVLSPPLLTLFLRMAGLAQRHGYDVYHTLCAQEWRDQDLLAAALLHDVGKGRLGVAPRMLWVLLGVRWPGLRRRLALHPFFGKRLGLWANLHHSELGAALVAEAQGSPALVGLIQQHKLEGQTDLLLLALRRADEDN